jgi:hypothetical protein
MLNLSSHPDPVFNGRRKKSAKNVNGIEGLLEVFSVLEGFLQVFFSVVLRPLKRLIEHTVYLHSQAFKKILIT